MGNYILLTISFNIDKKLLLKLNILFMNSCNVLTPKMLNEVGFQYSKFVNRKHPPINRFSRLLIFIFLSIDVIAKT